MCNRWFTLSAVALICGMAATQQLLATEIYKWVDEEGIVHYSSQLPSEVVQPIEILDIVPTSPADYDPFLDEYSIMNQAKRLPERETPVKKIPATREREEEQRQPVESEYDRIPYNNISTRYYTPPIYTRPYRYKRFKHGTINQPYYGFDPYRPQYRPYTHYGSRSFSGQHRGREQGYALKPKSEDRFQNFHGKRKHLHTNKQKHRPHVNQRNWQRGPRQSWRSHYGSQVIIRW